MRDGDTIATPSGAYERRRIDCAKGTEYEVTPERAAELIAYARSGEGDFNEFRPGWPMLDQRKFEDG